MCEASTYTPEIAHKVNHQTLREEGQRWIFDAPARIRSQPDTLVGAERVHRLDEPDGTDRDQILLVIRLGVVLFEDAFLKANLPRS